MEGDGLCLGAGDLIRLLDESLSLRCALLRYIHVSVQTAQTALANSRGNITNRLPRCLLMVHDRAAGDELRLTHEFFLVMLDVRRAGVGVALHDLDSRGLISTTRKSILIKSRASLEVAADGLYGVAERELARLVVPPANGGEGASTLGLGLEA